MNYFTNLLVCVYILVLVLDVLTCKAWLDLMSLYSITSEKHRKVLKGSMLLVRHILEMLPREILYYSVT